MHRQEQSEVIVDFAKQWKEKYGRGVYDSARTGSRIALAVLTTTNAVLGRPEKPRSVKQTVDELRKKHDDLFCMRAEHEILRGWSDDSQTGHVARAHKALELAIDLEMFIAGKEARRDDVQHTFAGKAADAFFQFAQRECVMKGHGLRGLARAVGIVLGEISIEEVVFG